MMTVRFKACLVAVPLVLSMWLSCIERDNPFDPANQTTAPSNQTAPLTPGQRDTVLADLDSGLVSLFDSAARSSPTLDSVLARLRADSMAAALVADSNATRRTGNDSLMRLNDTVVAHNSRADSTDSLRLKVFVDTLLWIPLNDTFPLVDQWRFTIAELRREAVERLDSVDARYPADTIYAPAARDSLLELFDSLDGRWEGVRESARSLYIWARNTNGVVVGPYNDTMDLYNRAVDVYNDSILFEKRYNPYPQIHDNDSLQVRLFNAEPGDTLVVASGTFSPTIRFVNSGSQEQPIVVQGQLDMSTVFEAPDVRLSANGNIVFQNLSFRAGTTNGAKLEAGSGPVTFRSCWFSDNGTWGLEVIDSDARLVDCRFTGNGTGGLRTTSSQSFENRVTLDNVLLAHNRFYGIEAVSANLSLRHVTVSDNGRDGIRLANPELDLEIYNSLLTFNSRYAINFESGFTGKRSFVLISTVIYGNTSIPAVASSPSATPAYWTFPVAFVDKDNDDYTIAPGNRVDDLESQGIVVGYRPR